MSYNIFWSFTFKFLVKMKSRNKGLREFWATLCIVMTEYSSDITDAARKMPRTKDTKDSVAYQSYSDELINDKIKEHRHSIYMALTSETLMKMFPQMKKIKDLPYSELEKCIILMTGIGINPYNISKILISGKKTVINTKSKRKKDILMLFPEI